MTDEKAPLERIFLDTMNAHAMTTPGETVLVAVSGGADSMALLELLLCAQEALQISLHVAHYEHGIRGEASIQDAAFVKDYCAARGIPFHMDSGNVPTLSRLWRTSLEDAARMARYAFLEETAKHVGAGKIALAHQREDQAETLMLHLTHGCGMKGLSAMRPVSGMYIRPLLDIGRDALEGYLRERGLCWREDETNLDPAYARNLLRLKVFPLLRQLNPRVSEAMARTARLAAEAWEHISSQAWMRLSGRVKRTPYGAFWLADYEPMDAILLRVLAEWAGVPLLDAEQTAKLMSISPGGVLNLPDGWRALRTRQRFHFISPRAAESEYVVSPLEFTQSSAQPGETGDGVRVQVFDADRLAGAVFRTRRDGDVFAPLGGGTQKLKQTLRDAGVDRPFRDILPLLAVGNRVLWIIGLKPSQDAAIQADTARTVRYEYLGVLPWELVPRASDMAGAAERI